LYGVQLLMKRSTLSQYLLQDADKHFQT